MRCFSLLLATVFLGGCLTPPVSEVAQWTERARQIQIGMRREEVERILTPAEVNYIMAMSSSGSRQESYVVAAHYAVTVSYASVDGARGTPHPDDRVLAPAVVEYYPPKNEARDSSPNAVTLQPGPIFRK